MGRPITVSATLQAASTNGICTVQALGGAGNLTINGSLATASVAALVNPQRVFITSTGNDAALTWTITGTDRNSTALTETITGGNAVAVHTTQDFLTVTRIAGSGATAGNVTAGISALGSSQWVPWDVNVLTKFEVSAYGIAASGNPAWILEVTFDDVYLLQLPTGVLWPRPVLWVPLVAQTGDPGQSISTSVINQTVRASRLTLQAAGTVSLTQTQQGD